MRYELILFSLTVAVLFVALLYLYLIVSIRVNGYTIFYKPMPKDPNYAKTLEMYQKRSSNKYIALTILAIVIVTSLIVLEARSALHKHIHDTAGALTIGAAATVFVGIVVVIVMSNMINQMSQKARD